MPERPRTAPALDSLLATKLYIPAPRPNRVPRPRLTGRLEAGVQGALTLISAPAGFGKSTLLSDWIHESGRRVAWVSLDEGDSDPVRFLCYAVTALSDVRPGLGEDALAALREARSAEPEVLEPILTGLLNEIHGLSRDLILVLDDYHVVDSPGIQEAVQFLLDRMPPQLHLVLSTRVDPPLHLSRLRARGQLTELRAKDLRFTSQEAADFLNQAMGLGLSAQDVEALEERTEGWAVGLQMAALSLQGRRDVGGFIEQFTGSHRFVLDYLTDEVLSRQRQGVRDFLLHTSILSRLSGPLADAVTGRDDGQAVLEELDAANLFLIPLDDTRTWYRYHHLFGTLLSHQLERQAGRAGVAELHERASAWYAAHGFPEDALEHALAAGAFDRAVAIVEENALPRLMRGDVGAPLRWVRRLPAEKLRTRPRLGMGQAWSLTLNLQWAEAEAAVAEAERALEITPDPEVALQAFVLRGFLARMRGEVSRATDAIQETLAQVPREDLFLRSLMTLDLGMAWREESAPDTARKVFEEARTLALEAGNVLVLVVAQAHLADLDVEEGRLRRALALNHEGLRLAGEITSRGGPLLAAWGVAYTGIAAIHYEQGDLDAASDFATRAVELGRRGGMGGNILHGMVVLARVRQARGDFAGAFEALAEAEGVMRRTGVAHWVQALHAYRSRLLLAQARAQGTEPPLDEVARWARESGLLADWRQPFDTRIFLPVYPPEFAHLTLARLFLARGNHDEALELLRWLREPAEAAGRLRALLDMLALETLVRSAAGDREGALQTLRRALALGEPEGFVRTFADKGAAMAGLIAEAAPGHVSPDYVRRLLDAFGKPEVVYLPVSVFPAPAPAKGAEPAEPLSEREVEVLRLIATGLSNADAGKRLFIAPSTVKKHLENIYSKLGTRNRTQAIARAREAGLL
ncbi:MAG TPA: LuxR C-terminal-related transcriptional regulator [Thermoanaerobaculia bacterium]